MWVVNDTATNNAYYLNTTHATQAEHQLACKKMGGHLASWESRAEQAMVEEYFYQSYYLKLPWHANYWMGLTTGRGKSREWYWLDRTIAYDNTTGYQAWGRLTGAVPLQEPNNLAGNENCAIGNWTMRNGSPSVFGWADQPCDMKLPAICKIRRRCRGLRWRQRAGPACSHCKRRFCAPHPHAALLTVSAALLRLHGNAAEAAV